MADDLDRLLQEKYTTVLRPRYGVFSNFYLGSSFQEYGKEIENFEVRDDDIWVSSFPKSGTTWTQEMVWLLANDLDYEGAKTLLGERFPFIDFNCVLDFKGYKKQHPDFELNENLLDPIKSLANMKSRRFIKTHLPWKFLPLQIRNQTTKAKIIHVIRNPKDTCISYHNHTNLLEGGRGTLDDFFKLFMAGKVIFGPYWENILSFWERRHLPNLLVITYEDMKRDLPSVIRKVSKFLDKELTNDQLEKLAIHLSFEEMKKNRAVNFEPLVDVVKPFYGDKYEANGTFMRSGVVGSYKSEMTQEMISSMDEWIRQNTAGTGLIFSE